MNLLGTAHLGPMELKFGGQVLIAITRVYDNKRQAAVRLLYCKIETEKGC